MIENVTSQFGLLQIIKEPILILDNSSSCIDLVFTSQANLLIKSGVQPSLHSNCHQFAIFNRTVLNILNNFITHETTVCNNKDP